MEDKECELIPKIRNFNSQCNAFIVWKYESATFNRKRKTISGFSVS